MVEVRDRERSDHSYISAKNTVLAAVRVIATPAAVMAKTATRQDAVF